MIFLFVQWDLFCFAPSGFFWLPGLQIICCHIARYYVKSSLCDLGVVKGINPLSWVGQSRIYPKIFYVPHRTAMFLHKTRVEVWRWIFVRNAVKCGEKNIIFTAYFLHLFAVNAVNRGELFIFTASSVFLQKRIIPRVRTYDLLHAIHSLVHCGDCHLHL